MTIVVWYTGSDFRNLSTSARARSCHHRNRHPNHRPQDKHMDFADVVSHSLRACGCQPGDHYPRAHGLPVMRRLPRNLKSMPNPCAGVPANAWCPARRK